MAYKQAVCCALLCVLQILVPCKSDEFIERASTEEEMSMQTAEGCSPAPKGCPNSNISFYLYTRDTQDSPYLLDPSNPDTIKNANFVEGVPLKVTFHGYTGNMDSSPHKELRPAYFEHGEYNIITVDWGVLAQTPCYAEAAENVYVVAECTAELLDSLYSTRSELDIDNSHFIGFSLGAHAAGLTGSNLKTGKVARVTGLDAAMPRFDDFTKTREQRLNSDAAKFVDVYHSNGGFEGKKAVCGDVDVYFNDGTCQPGCDCYSSCEHKRSVLYFAESINSATGLWAFPCDDWDSYVNGSCSVLSTDDLVKFGNSLSLPEDRTDRLVLRDLLPLSGKYISITNSASPFLLEPSVYISEPDLASQVDGSCSTSDYMQNMG